MDEPVPFASAGYWLLFAVLMAARGMDFLSTWVATPRLVLEGNPIAKWLGWKWGALVNVGLVVGLAFLPLSAIVVSTASLLVAARNFQSAWMMRTMGEQSYRSWYLQRMADAPRGLYLFCLAGNALPVAALGGALVWSSTTKNSYRLVPTGIGMGLVAYAAAVLFYTLLSVWRTRRARRYDGAPTGRLATAPEARTNEGTPS